MKIFQVAANHSWWWRHQRRPWRSIISQRVPGSWFFKKKQKSVHQKGQCTRNRAEAEILEIFKLGPVDGPVIDRLRMQITRRKILKVFNKRQQPVGQVVSMATTKNRQPIKESTTLTSANEWTRYQLVSRGFIDDFDVPFAIKRTTMNIGPVWPTATPPTSFTFHGRFTFASKTSNC